jgi:iron complex outermembrane recepter protein
MTVGDTLVLIDGKRMVAYPISDDNQGQFTDISAIPINAIDHMEVLKDGASAIYGADAIAGVVNIILKKSFSGFEATAQGGTSDKHDGTTEHLAVLDGIGDLDADGYNAYRRRVFDARLERGRRPKHHTGK